MLMSRHAHHHGELGSRTAHSGIPEPRRSERVRFPGGNGYELAGILDLPADPGSGAPVVVFSHCFTCNKDLKAIVRLGRDLAARGVSVLRYDMTGLGNSDGDFSKTDFTTNLADLRAAVAYMLGAFGRVTGLLGHSFGGAASLAYAGEIADTGSPLGAVAALAAPSDTQHLANLLARRNPAIDGSGQGMVEIGGRPWLIRRQMLDDFRRHRLEDSIAKIAIPLMVLHSPVDETLGFDHALRIMQLAGSARENRIEPFPVSLVALDGADHLLAQNVDDLSYVAGLLAAFFWRYRGNEQSHS